MEEKTTKPIAYTVNSENGCVTLSEAHFAELQRTIQTLRAQLEQRELACFLAKQVFIMKFNFCTLNMIDMKSYIILANR